MPSATSTDPKVQEDSEPQRAQRAPAAPVAIEKAAAMTYTERVMQQAASAVAVDKLSDQDYEKLMQQKWQKMLAESASRIAHKPAPVDIFHQSFVEKFCHLNQCLLLSSDGSMV